MFTVAVITNTTRLSLSTFEPTLVVSLTESVCCIRTVQKINPSTLCPIKQQHCLLNNKR